MKFSNTRRLTESAVLIALATVLSVIKIVKMPVGGSVTPASMLPILLIAYRHGAGWGFGAGLVYSVVQTLFGIGNFSYVTGFPSVVAVLLLDYLLAFTLIGTGAFFRKEGRSAPVALALGAMFTGVLRFLCHTLAGATVWEGLLFPTSAALLSSAAYNAAYMVPETILYTIAAAWCGAVFDVGAPSFTRTKRAQSASVFSFVLAAVGGMFLAFAVVFASVTFFYYLQSDGSYSFSNLSSLPWRTFTLVTGASVIAGALLLWFSDRKSH